MNSHIICDNVFVGPKIKNRERNAFFSFKDMDEYRGWIHTPFPDWIDKSPEKKVKWLTGIKGRRVEFDGICELIFSLQVGTSKRIHNYENLINNLTEHDNRRNNKIRKSIDDLLLNKKDNFDKLKLDSNSIDKLIMLRHQILIRNVLLDDYMIDSKYNGRAIINDELKRTDVYGNFLKSRGDYLYLDGINQLQEPNESMFDEMPALVIDIETMNFIPKKDLKIPDWFFDDVRANGEKGTNEEIEKKYQYKFKDSKKCTGHVFMISKNKDNYQGHIVSMFEPNFKKRIVKMDDISAKFDHVSNIITNKEIELIIQRIKSIPKKNTDKNHLERELTNPENKEYLKLALQDRMVSKTVAEYIKKSQVIIGHNLAYDFTELTKGSKREVFKVDNVGYSIRITGSKFNKQVSISNKIIFDTYVIAKELYPELKKKKLDNFIEYLAEGNIPRVDVSIDGEESNNFLKPLSHADINPAYEIIFNGTDKQGLRQLKNMEVYGIGDVLKPMWAYNKLIKVREAMYNVHYYSKIDLKDLTLSANKLKQTQERNFYIRTKKESSFFANLLRTENIEQKENISDFQLLNPDYKSNKSNTFVYFPIGYHFKDLAINTNYDMRHIVDKLDLKGDQRAQLYYELSIQNIIMNSFTKYSKIKESERMYDEFVNVHLLDKKIVNSVMLKINHHLGDKSYEHITKLINSKIAVVDRITTLKGMVNISKENKLKAKELNKSFYKTELDRLNPISNPLWVRWYHPEIGIINKLKDNEFTFDEKLNKKYNKFQENFNIHKSIIDENETKLHNITKEMFKTEDYGTLLFLTNTYFDIKTESYNFNSYQMNIDDFTERMNYAKNNFINELDKFGYLINKQKGLLVEAYSDKDNSNELVKSEGLIYLGKVK